MRVIFFVESKSKNALPSSRRAESLIKSEEEKKITRLQLQFAGKACGEK
jgi:hypothetical protein